MFKQSECRARTQLAEDIYNYMLDGNEVMTLEELCKVFQRSDSYIFNTIKELVSDSVVHHDLNTVYLLKTLPMHRVALKDIAKTL